MTEISYTFPHLFVLNVFDVDIRELKRLRMRDPLPLYKLWYPVDIINP
jgi:hypothetical protein